VDRDEVGFAQQLLQPHQSHAELGRTGRLYVRVVGDQASAEGGDPLGEQHTDTAEADHPDGLAGHLDAGVPRALPLPCLERGRRRGGIAGHREQQATACPGGGDGVRVGRD
jgi:hypothetical protein